MIFYVNSIENNSFEVKYPNKIIGLFGEHGWEGRGNFCGWYGAEYYLNTELYAYYTADCSGLYTPELRISDVVVCDPPIHYDEIAIGSGMWDRRIEADDLEEALGMFANAEWTR